LAAQIKKNHHLETKLVTGSGGVFKVWLDQELLWDKHTAGRFPEEEEILSKITERKG